MSELFKQSPLLNQSTPPERQNAESVSAVPPPPAATIEVIIRTLASDLELMAQQGGNAPPPAAQPRITIRRATDPLLKKARNPLLWVWIAVGVVGASVFFAAGYLVLPQLLTRESSPAALVEPEMAAPGGLSAATTTTPRPVLAQAAYLNQPADQNIVITLPAGEGLGERARTALRTAVETATSTPWLSEIALADFRQSAFAWAEFSEAFAGGPLLPADLWSLRFEESFSFLLYKDDKGVWPVFVLKLREGNSPLLLRSALADMESRPARAAELFLFPPGPPRPAFQDLLLGGQPVRALAFENPGAVFMYGWLYNKFLILSTSEAAFKQAAQRL